MSNSPSGQYQVIGTPLFDYINALGEKREKGIPFICYDEEGSTVFDLTTAMDLEQYLSRHLKDYCTYEIKRVGEPS